jgi:regulator of protease activity HflC (stomatin/prohibitin superfamily)
MLEIIALSAISATCWGLVRLEQVQEGECGLVLRFGKHHRTTGPGACLLIRGIESLTRVPTKIILFRDLIADRCQTGDGALVMIRYHLRLRAVVPAKVLKVENWQEASLVQAEVAVRGEVTGHSAREILTGRTQFGASASAELEQVTCTWGTTGEIEIADVLVLSQMA